MRRRFGSGFLTIFAKPFFHNAQESKMPQDKEEERRLHSLPMQNSPMSGKHQEMKRPIKNGLAYPDQQRE